MTLIRIGDRVKLNGGIEVTIKDVHPICGVFVHSESPVDRCVAGNGPSKGQPLGLGNHFWVEIQGWKIVNDKDGCPIGIMRD